MALTLPTSAELSTRLDAFESRLPVLSARVLRLQRMVAGATYDRTTEALEAVAGSVKAILTAARNSGAAVVDQTRAATEDVVAAVHTGITGVAGQARAQGRTVADRVERESTALVDAAIDAVDDSPGTGTPYEQWTKAELVERAKEVGIAGPTRLGKAELIAALRAA